MNKRREERNEASIKIIMERLGKLVDDWQGCKRYLSNKSDVSENTISKLLSDNVDFRGSQKIHDIHLSTLVKIVNGLAENASRKYKDFSQDAAFRAAIAHLFDIQQTDLETKKELFESDKWCRYFMREYFASQACRDKKGRFKGYR